MSNKLLHNAFVSIVFGLATIACQPDPLAPWNWERAETGLPHQAIVQTIAINPHDFNDWWLGYYAPGGLATSRDGGQSWSMSGPAEPVLADNPVFDLLAAAANNQTILWAATRDGLLHSVDLGQSWLPVGGRLPAATAFALDVDAAGRLYVGLDQAGIFAQTDDGQAWQGLDGSEPLQSAAVLSLDVSADGQHIYAGTAARGLFASQDGGLSWVNTYPDRYGPNVALNPANPLVAVAGLRDRLVRTVDGGQSWHTLLVAWAEDEITALLWLPDGTLGVGTGRGRLYRSNDAGDSWVEGGDGLPANQAVLDLKVADELSAGRSSRVLAGTWTGLYASDDGGQNWTHLAPSLGVPNAHALLTTEHSLLLGTQAGLFRWQPEQQGWVSAAEAFASQGVAALARAPSEEQVLYAGTVDNGVYRSDDGGLSWRPLPSLSVGIPALAVDPSSADHLYMLAAWERIYESRDGGRSWLARWEGLGVTTEAVSLAIDPAASAVYLGGDTGLYRSVNGQDWAWIGPDLVDQSVLALLVQPVPDILGGGSILYIGTTRGAYRSLDGGKSIQGSDPDLGWGRGLQQVSVTAFLIDPHDPQQLYAGTAYQGVYQSLDWGQSWQPLGPPELESEVVEALAWGPAGELFVAAAGGVWRGLRE